MLAFAGPAYLVSVGYMDPGNWATDLEGGARFGYRLLWVLVVSNLMAILLQAMSARLGIASGRDLAQACRDSYSRPTAIFLWILCEIAIAACDLAEVLGAAIALNLLLGLPLIWGVCLTALDTLLVLWLSRYGIRLIEAVILSLIAIVTGCFLVELVWARPVWETGVLGRTPSWCLSRPSPRPSVPPVRGRDRSGTTWPASCCGWTRQAGSDGPGWVRPAR